MKKIITLVTFALATISSSMYAATVTIGEISNNTDTDLVLRIDNKKVLEIPAHTAVRKGVTLQIIKNTGPYLTTEGFIERVEFVDRNNQLVAVLTGGLVPNTSIVWFNLVGQNKYLAEFFREIPNTQPTDNYTLRIKFIKKPTGEFAVTDDGFNVSRSGMPIVK